MNRLDIEMNTQPKITWKTLLEKLNRIISGITKAHMFQSILAGAYVLFVFWLLDFLHSQLAVTSLGASAFIVFSRPAHQNSHLKTLIVGYCIGIFSGLLCCGLYLLPHTVFFLPIHILACSLAVCISMFLMTSLNFKHPPASALALAIATDNNPFVLSIAALACIVILCVLKELLKKYLRNL